MSSSADGAPLQVFRPQPRVGIFVPYGLAGLAGAVVVAFVARHFYVWAVGRLDPEASHSAAVVFLVIGLGIGFVPGTVLFRWRHIQATVYRDRVVMSNGYTVTTLPFAELRRVIRVHESDGPDAIVFEHHGKNRTGYLALKLLCESQQDEFMALINCLLARCGGT